jgi:hypothetical protein
MSPHAIIWAVAVVVTAGGVIRPFDWSETVLGGERGGTAGDIGFAREIGRPQRS